MPTDESSGIEGQITRVGGTVPFLNMPVLNMPDGGQFHLKIKTPTKTCSVHVN